jgi:hypothetical protein
MASYLSTSVSLVLFSAGRHLRAANEPRTNGASEADVIWTNNDLERLSDHRPTSIVGQIREEVTAVAAASPPHITPAIRVMSEFQRHLLNPEDKGMMEKVLFQ